MAKKKKAVVEEGYALKDPTESINEIPATEETRPIDEALSDIVAKQTDELTKTEEPSPFILDDKRLLNENEYNCAGVIPKEVTEQINEPVAITEIKPLSEKVLASLYEKHNVPRDFNASHPRWNVPSVKNRYALLLADISIHEKL